MDCSTPGLCVLHYLPEFAQTHVHWVHDAVHPSHPVVPVSSCTQSFPASGSFPRSQLFTSGGQSIRASASVLPVNIQGWFLLGLTDLISLLSKGLSSVFSSTTVRKHQFFSTQPSLWSNIHICYLTTGKTIALHLWTFVGKVVSPLFIRYLGFLSKSNYLLTSWLQLSSTVIFGVQKIKSLTASIVFHLFSIK